MIGPMRPLLAGGIALVAPPAQSFNSEPVTGNNGVDDMRS